MSHRFFVPALDPRAREAELPADEARHLARVLRLGPGARVAVFDGRGAEWTAEIVAVARDRATVRLLAAAVPAPEPRVPIALALAVLKGDKMDDVVRDAVMLGAAAVQPMVTERTEVALAALARGARVERWRRIAVSAAKQCRRAVVPDVAAPLPLDEILAVPVIGVRLALAEPAARGLSTIAAREVPAPAAAQLLVGPEGGWSDAELDRLRAAGAIGVRLGGRTLRADAVPLVAMAALQAVWGDL